MQKPLPSWFSSSLGCSPPSPPSDRHHSFRSRASATIRSLASPDRDCTSAFSQTWRWRGLSRDCQPFRGFSLVPPASSKTTPRWVMGSPSGPSPLPARAPRPRTTSSSTRVKRDGLQGRHQATSVSPNELRSKSGPDGQQWSFLCCRAPKRATPRAPGESGRKKSSYPQLAHISVDKRARRPGREPCDPAANGARRRRRVLWLAALAR